MGLSIALPVNAAEQIIRPVASGTIADGGTHGPFGGGPDAADWFFNESSFEGAITLVLEPPPALEQRVVFEYNLAGVTLPTPLTAHFHVEVRGAARFPAETATLEVRSYAADLVEALSDYDAESSGLVAAKPVAPFQPATSCALEVSDLINDALLIGPPRVGFRMQIRPVSPTDSLQVFIDVLDSEPTTVPFLRLVDRVPGDGNNDRLVDETDFALIVGCLGGPGANRPGTCAAFDFYVDAHVDLADYARFERAFAAYGN